MKLEEIKMHNYTAYVLDDASRSKIQAKYPPKYPKVIGHHITVNYGVPPDTALPPLATAKIVGYVDSKDGLEAFVVAINGSVDRPDGNTYHLTWSLDPAKYSPKDSNTLIGNAHSRKFKIILPIVVKVTPTLL